MQLKKKLYKPLNLGISSWDLSDCIQGTRQQRASLAKDRLAAPAKKDKKSAALFSRNETMGRQKQRFALLSNKLVGGNLPFKRQSTKAHLHHLWPLHESMQSNMQIICTSKTHIQIVSKTHHLPLNHPIISSLQQHQLKSEPKQHSAKIHMKLYSKSRKQKNFCPLCRPLQESLSSSTLSTSSNLKASRQPMGRLRPCVWLGSKTRPKKDQKYWSWGGIQRKTGKTISQISPAGDPNSKNYKAEQKAKFNPDTITT